MLQSRSGGEHICKLVLHLHQILDFGWREIASLGSEGVTDNSATTSASSTHLFSKVIWSWVFVWLQVYYMSDIWQGPPSQGPCTCPASWPEMCQKCWAPDHPVRTFGPGLAFCILLAVLYELPLCSCKRFGPHGWSAPASPGLTQWTYWTYS